MRDRVQPGTVLEGTYRIERRIAEGGMGEVYEASHVRLDGRYAVKVLHRDVPLRHPTALARFRREARITSALRHPGIVQVIDFNAPADGPPFLVMELLEGASLADVIAREAPFPLARVEDITGQIASALSAVHRQGVVHRDLNPTNVFVMDAEGDQPERVKVLDFGISKMRWASKDLTGSTQVLGTPQYMAPEQAEGRVKDMDQAADQFSLAAIVYEMLTGQPAFTGDTLATVAYRVVHAMPEPVSRLRGGLGPSVDAVVARGLAKDRRERFESVAAFAAAFRQAAFPTAADGAVPRGAQLPAPPWNQADTVVTPPPKSLDQLPAQSGRNARRARERRREPRTVVLRRRRRWPWRARLGGRWFSRLAGLARVHPRVLIAVAAGVVAAGVAASIATWTPRPHGHRASPTGVVRASAPLNPLVQPIQPRPPSLAASASPDLAAAPDPIVAAPSHAADLPAPPVASLAGASSRLHPAPKTAAVQPTAFSRDDSERLERELGLGAAGSAAPRATSCSVTLGSSPWAAVWIDGSDTGKHTPLVQLPLSCGRHVLELKRRDLRLGHLEMVVLRAGDPLKARYRLEPSAD